MAIRWTSLIAAFVLVLSSCSSATGESAETSSPPATEAEATSDVDTSPEAEAEAEVEPDTPAPVDPVEGWPEWLANPEPRVQLQRAIIPRVPPIVLPDLSLTTEVGASIESALGDQISSATSLDVLSATCAVDGPLGYQSDGSTDLFGEGGSVAVEDFEDGTDVQLTVEADGSGTFVDNSGTTFVEVEVDADGAGTYVNLTDDINLSLDIDAGGFGSYSDRTGDRLVDMSLRGDGSASFEDFTGQRQISVMIESDGSALYRDLSGANLHELSRDADGRWVFDDGSEGRNLTVTVNADGSGAYDDFSGDAFIAVLVNADGSASYQDASGDNDFRAIVNADGSWSMDDLGGDNSYGLIVEADGRGSFTDINNTSGLQEGQLTPEQTAAIAVFVQPLLDAANAKTILHPDLVSAGPTPEFAKVDRFPPLGTLPQLSTPCATVLRLDSEFLFDFGSANLREGANPVLDEVAAALIDAQQGIEIHGHTDAIGDDASNQALSESRAGAVEAALVERGVTVTITSIGFGETEPVAPNMNDDGSDNPAGRQLNRRVEIVLFE